MSDVVSPLELAAEAFVEKMQGFTEASVECVNEDGSIIVKIDGDIGTFNVDGSYTSDCPAVLNAMEKHYKAPSQGDAPAEASPVLPLPGRNPNPAAPHDLPRDPQEDGDDMYGKIASKYGFSLLEIFGETGTLKSKFCVQLALDAAAHGRKAFYLDTEDNLTPDEIKALVKAGVTYHYTPVLAEIEKFIMKDVKPLKTDLLIIDSVGMPILRMYSSMGLNEKGNAFLRLIAWLGVLKEWSFSNRTISIITNQPTSEFGKSEKDKGDARNPFGDKANFLPAHIFLAKKATDTEKESKGYLIAFRSRLHGRGAKCFETKVNASGVQIGMVSA